MNILLITTLAIGFSTFFGTVGGLLIRKIPHKYNDMILGGASGIMLGAAILGLIVPASEKPEQPDNNTMQNENTGIIYFFIFHHLLPY